jgi:hypothetical protein
MKSSRTCSFRKEYYYSVNEMLRNEQTVKKLDSKESDCPWQQISRRGQYATYDYGSFFRIFVERKFLHLLSLFLTHSSCFMIVLRPSPIKNFGHSGRKIAVASVFIQI